ncbi:hypothetical protein COCON_G00213850, partial [Conger conger]
MATVREKAAALNLSGKLFSPMHRPPDPRMANKPFRATYIWSSIINSLQSQVEVKRRRHNLKSHNDCFLGSEAVDVVLAHVIQNKFFGDAEIPRTKVVRVCQALMDRKVFEAVGTKVFGKEKKRATFEDSSFSLYRFLNTPLSNSTDSPGASESPGFDKTFYSTPCKRQEEEYLNSTPINADKSLEDLLGNLNQSPAQTPQLTVNSGLSQTLVEAVWQEQTVLRLLQLVELPLLDGLLVGADSPLPPLRSMDSDPNLLYTSNYLDREILKAFSDSQADDWLSAAVDCLEFLPDQLVVEVSRGLPGCLESQQSKRLLFDALARHYGQPACPALLTNHMFDIHSGITDLLVNGKLTQALEALQLCLKQLDPRSREELRRLLRFMALAADPAALKLHTELENRMAVKRAFSRAIVHGRHLAKGKLDLLVLFLMDNHREVLKIPGSLHKLVSDKLACIARGKDPDAIGLSYCRRVTAKVYVESSEKTTKEELLVLLRSIHENPKLSAK